MAGTLFNSPQRPPLQLDSGEERGGGERETEREREKQENDRRPWREKKKRVTQITSALATETGRAFIFFMI